jgi:hypothetical protein
MGGAARIVASGFSRAATGGQERELRRLAHSATAASEDEGLTLNFNLSHRVMRQP